MLPYFSDCYFNASSLVSSHLGADRPRARAARALARALNAEDPSSIVFTSGATESNNWVFSSVAEAYSGPFVISSVEHASVKAAAMRLKEHGREVREVPVNENGEVNVSALADLLDEDVCFVSIMATNNETGVINPINEIADIIRDRAPNALFHSDATQIMGKTPVDLQGDFGGVDLLSFSGHKFHGPKGVGGLYMRPGVELAALFVGGNQENGARAGTTNTPALAGLAAAAEEFVALCPADSTLRDAFESGVPRIDPTAIIHGASARRLFNTSCLSFPGARGSDIVELLLSEGIVVGTGSACSASSLHPPETLLKMGIDYDIAGAAIRVSFSRFNSPDHVIELLDALTKVLPAARLLRLNVSAV